MNKRVKFFSILVLFFAIILFSKISYCADGSLKASQVVSGEKITVTITSSKSLGAYTLKTSGAVAIDGSSDVGAYGNNTISGASASGVTNLGKFVFNVPEKDTKVTFSVSQLATDIDDNDLEINSTSITLKGKKVETTTDKKEETTDKKEETTDKKEDTSSANKGTSTTNKDNTTQEKPKEKSNNAYLSTLGVTPKEYDFSGFSKTKMSYNVTVPNDVNSLKVLYKTADSNAKVSVSGNSGFEVGSDNKITIKVTAEDGKATKTYTIKVTKLAEEEEKPGNVIEDEEDLYLTSLSIEGIEISPEFAKDTYSYKATINQANLTQVKVNATASIADANIEVSGNNDLVIGENLINIVLTTEGTVEQKVYQIVLTIEKQEENVENEIVNSTDSNLIGNLKNYAIIAIVVVALIVIAIIVLICLLIRENKKINDDDYDYEEEIEDKKAKRVKKEEYNVYEDNQNVGRRRGKHSR